MCHTWGKQISCAVLKCTYKGDSEDLFYSGILLLSCFASLWTDASLSLFNYVALVAACKINVQLCVPENCKLTLLMLFHEHHDLVHLVSELPKTWTFSQLE